MSTASSRHLFQAITDQIVKAIEDGASEYRMPWVRAGHRLDQPLNALSKRPYRGINILLLWLRGHAAGYETGRWATYRQWREAGAQVRKGERATTVLLWKEVRCPSAQQNDEDRTEAPSRPIARAFKLFNADQVDGSPLEELASLPPDARSQLAEEFFAAIPADVKHGGDCACYVAGVDRIDMPLREQFRSDTSYYSVFAHELTHWTGAKHRLDRDLSGRFGSEAYAMEELVAELGAAFVCAHLSLPSQPREDHAPYVASWLKVLRDDPRAVVTAASKAQAAADYLISAARKHNHG